MGALRGKFCDRPPHMPQLTAISIYLTVSAAVRKMQPPRAPQTLFMCLLISTLQNSALCCFEKSRFRPHICLK